MLKYTDDSPPLPANQRACASRRNARENVQPPLSLECSIIGMQIACTGMHGIAFRPRSGNISREGIASRKDHFCCCIAPFRSAF